MTVGEEQGETSENEAAEQPGDPLLVAFVRMIAEGEGLFSMDLTLLVDGVYVSGTPISFAGYCAGVGGVLGEAMERTGGSGDVWRESFEELAETAKADQQQRAPRHYLHLQNAVADIQGTFVLVPFWRGRTESVSAWFPGGLSQRRE